LYKFLQIFYSACLLCKPFDPTCRLLLEVKARRSRPIIVQQRRMNGYHESVVLISIEPRDSAVLSFIVFRWHVLKRLGEDHELHRHSSSSARLFGWGVGGILSKITNDEKKLNPNSHLPSNQPSPVVTHTLPFFYSRGTSISISFLVAALYLRNTPGCPFSPPPQNIRRNKHCLLPVWGIAFVLVHILFRPAL